MNKDKVKISKPINPPNINPVAIDTIISIPRNNPIIPLLYHIIN